MSSSDPEERRRRRALLKAHHPDLGGDAEAFIRLTSALGTGRPGSSSAAGPGGEVRFVRRPRGLARFAAWYRRQQRRRAGGPPRVL